jgi:hypothetical protein
MTRPPDATGRRRIGWGEVPDAVRASIEDLHDDAAEPSGCTVIPIGANHCP